MVKATTMTTDTPMAVDYEDSRLASSSRISERMISDAARVLTDEALGREPDLRSRVFREIVTGENDLTGYVAFGLHEQNRRDWLALFSREHQRQPNESELNAWLTGEITPRRLATYRRLAADSLNGRAAPLDPKGEAAATRSLRDSIPAAANESLPAEAWTPPDSERLESPGPALLRYALLIGAILIGLYLFVRYGAPMMFGR